MPTGTKIGGRLHKDIITRWNTEEPPKLCFIYNIEDILYMDMCSYCIKYRNCNNISSSKNICKTLEG